MSDEATRRLLAYLAALDPKGIRPGLERMLEALERLAHPERRYRIVRVGGTNGKGSVSVLVAAALENAGHRVGLYTSPHLVEVTERIRVDGARISPHSLARGIGEVRLAIERAPAVPLTYFELLTAVALLEFARRAVDVAVLEVGLGGRWDATNVGRAEVAVLTNVELDHTEFLGRTRRKIAAEKVEIAPPGGHLVTGVRRGAAREVIEARCREKGVALHTPRLPHSTRAALHYRGSRYRLDGVPLGLGGGYQPRNAALAVRALECLDELGFEIPAAAVKSALRETRWPGRLQVLSRRPLHVLDGAHNPHGARALSRALPALLRGVTGERVLVLGALRSKRPAAILDALARPPIDHVIATSVPGRDAILPTELARLARAHGFDARAVPSVAQALLSARRLAGRDGAVVVAGSLYLLGAAMKRLRVPLD